MARDPWIAALWRVCYWPTPEPYHWIAEENPNVLSSKSGPQISGAIPEDEARRIVEAHNAVVEKFRAANSHSRGDE